MLWNPNTLTHSCPRLHINGYFCSETRPTRSLSPKTPKAFTSWSFQTDLKVCIKLSYWLRLNGPVYIISPHWQRKCTALCSWWQTRTVSTVSCWPLSAPDSRSSRSRRCSPKPEINAWIKLTDIALHLLKYAQGSIYLTKNPAKAVKLWFLFIFIFEYVFNVIYFCNQSWIFSIITTVFSVTRPAQERFLIIMSKTVLLYIFVKFSGFRDFIWNANCL